LKGGLNAISIRVKQVLDEKGTKAGQRITTGEGNAGWAREGGRESERKLDKETVTG
jgi:hypothetical protein